MFKIIYVYKRNTKTKSDDVITPENECTLEEALKYKAYVPREKYLSNELHG